VDEGEAKVEVGRFGLSLYSQDVDVDFIYPDPSLSEICRLPLLYYPYITMNHSQQGDSFLWELVFRGEPVFSGSQFSVRGGPECEPVLRYELGSPNPKIFLCI
jgi:hypothetical protein